MSQTTSTSADDLGDTIDLPALGAVAVAAGPSTLHQVGGSVEDRAPVAAPPRDVAVRPRSAPADTAPTRERPVPRPEEPAEAGRAQ